MFVGAGYLTGRDTDSTRNSDSGNANCSLLRFPGNMYLLDLNVILGKKSGLGTRSRLSHRALLGFDRLSHSHTEVMSLPKSGAAIEGNV